MDIFMNLTDMNTIIFSWIISVLLKFHEYEYEYALDIVSVIDFFYSCLRC